MLQMRNRSWRKNNIILSDINKLKILVWVCVLSVFVLCVYETCLDESFNLAFFYNVWNAFCYVIQFSFFFLRDIVARLTSDVVYTRGLALQELQEMLPDIYLFSDKIKSIL